MSYQSLTVRPAFGMRRAWVAGRDHCWEGKSVTRGPSPETDREREDFEG
jgi:hypothetical protein